MKTQKTSKKQHINESKKTTFIDSGTWTDIVQNIKGIMMSEGSMTTLLDIERVLDEADLYAFKNWELGELVDGPIIKRYSCVATFMWPHGLMPDPRGAKRLVSLGCNIKFKKTTIKVPVKIKTADDYAAGLHYPKLINREVWLVNITMPKSLMNDIREGSIDLANQTIELEDLDDAFAKDYDSKDQTGDEQSGGMDDGMGGMGGMDAGMGDMGAAPPAPGMGM